ncbi:hypothetical protein Tco_0195448 [Tanacetum coccineum]
MTAHRRRARSECVQGVGVTKLHLRGQHMRQGLASTTGVSAQHGERARESSALFCYCVTGDESHGLVEDEETLIIMRMVAIKGVGWFCVLQSLCDGCVWLSSDEGGIGDEAVGNERGESVIHWTQTHQRRRGQWMIISVMRIVWEWFDCACIWYEMDVVGVFLSSDCVFGIMYVVCVVDVLYYYSGGGVEGEEVGKEV